MGCVSTCCDHSREIICFLILMLASPLSLHMSVLRSAPQWAPILRSCPSKWKFSFRVLWAVLWKHCSCPWLSPSRRLGFCLCIRNWFLRLISYLHVHFTSASTSTLPLPPFRLDFCPGCLPPGFSESLPWAKPRYDSLLSLALFSFTTFSSEG